MGTSKAAATKEYVLDMLLQLSQLATIVDLGRLAGRIDDVLAAERADEPAKATSTTKTGAAGKRDLDR